MWLLENNVRKRLENAYNSSFVPSSEQYLAFETANSQSGGSKTESGTATILVHGVLTKSPDIFSILFGGGNTTYSDIIMSLTAAQSNDEVGQIVLDIDSPGGQFDGLFDVIDAISAVSKPVKAVVSGLGASAAFAIAAQADEIVATNIASRVGSIGVVATFDATADEISITSTNAPNKRPDVTSENGAEIVRKELDAMEDIFIDSIAKGRNTTSDNVRENFGRGSTFLAQEALDHGMIDSIRNKNSSAVTEKMDFMETSKMDLKQLQSQHPEVLAAAISEGVSQERDRTVAHLTLGEQSGDLKTAFDAIKSGSEMTSTLQATYMAAGMNRAAVDSRQSDDVVASAADATSKDELAHNGAADVISIIESKLGIKGV